ncbi:hypothetical protein BCS98_18440 [Vibrio breoganii]|uniref:hypothetical protein n=1 Tax=Vibrio breoganii TaxID=553239 RepID=UPI000C83D5AF|nr:hypothetical protein [Vibrio breoganii]PMO86644.1 hypothetical protein BCS98_18440 [Vibrio breoganii]
MKISKSVIAVAISSAFLFGCDFDVGSENNVTTPPGGGDGGGGLPPVENAQNYVQIQDSSTTDVGLLRVKTSESKSEIAVDDIPVGYLTVDLTYQDNKAINDGEDKSAYVQVHTDGTGNAELRAEISFSNGSIKSRDTSGSQTDVIGTYTVGEELKVKVSWTETEYTLTVDGQDLGTFAARNTKPVQYISLKVGDKDTKSNYELIADNLEIYNTTDAGDELVFEDDFDHYGVGDDLTDSRYNSALEAMVFGTGSDNGGDNGGDGGDIGGDVTDNFDSYTVGAQISDANSVYKAKNVDNSTTFAIVSDQQAKSGTNSLYLEDDSAAVYEGEGDDAVKVFDGIKPTIGREFSTANADSGSVSTSVYIPTDGYESATYLYLGNDTGASSSKRFTEVIFTSSMIKYRDIDKKQQDLVSYSKDTWVDLEISWVADQVTVTVDGVTAGSFTAEKADGLQPSAFALSVGDNASAGTYSYFDNLNSDLF